ncbi:MAG: hypothetical protein F4018_08190 [Acidobacteria bacterium]|nr:hypothetical protein [Acidobacteriota bacterium]
MARVPRIADIPQQLSPKAFWDLFGRLEHAELDFKRGVPADIRDTIAAMAMTHGGLIVHGVDDRRVIVGCPLSQNTQDRITRIATECGVDVQLLALTVGDLELTVCAVPEIRGRIVTTPDGRLLRRVGGDSQPLRGDAMARFVRDREHRAGEDEPLAIVDLLAFDLAAVNQALAADGRPAVTADGIERALTDLGVAVPAAPPLKSRVLRAAQVLFASDPRKSVCGAAVQLMRRAGVDPGPGPSSAREECAGPLADTMDCCLRFVAAHTRQFETVTGSRREALSEYPELVLREAIVNALAHRVRRQLLLPVVLPQLRMLPAILRMIVPAISDESRAAAPTAGSRPPGVPPGRRARRGTGRAPDPDPDNPSHLVNRRGRPGHPGPPRRSITSPMHY